MKIILAIVLGFGITIFGVVIIGNEQMDAIMEAQSNSVE